MQPIEPFTNDLPVRVSFGAGAVRGLADALAEVGSRRPFVLLDPGIEGLATVAAALAAVPGAQVEVAQPGEPTVDRVDAVGATLRGSGCDGVVAIGGGSVLDTAKGARLVAELGGSIRRFAWPGEPEPIPALALPLVTVPTTAGTGSEVTGGIVMVDEARGLKVGAASPHNRAARSLVDPELTYGLPREPTLYGGVDALAQGIAAAIVRVRTPVAIAIGLEAARLAAEALPVVVREPGHRDARAAMACASLLAGFAMNLSEAGTEHSLAHALGALRHLPHGLTVGLVLAESLEHDRRFVPELAERAADALGAPRSPAADGSRLIAAVHALLAELELPTLQAVGIGPGDLDALVGLARAAWIPVEPGPWSEADVRAAYERALALGAAR